MFLIFFITYFIVKPNVVENTVSIIFICSSFFMEALVKSITGELRPFMLSRINNLGFIHVIDCVSDYGNPSGHMI